MTDYPNREHENADKAARRRALNALNDIEGEVAYLRRRIAGDLADGDDTSTLAQRTTDVTRQLAILGALRDVREWLAADAREAQADCREVRGRDRRPGSGSGLMSAAVDLPLTCNGCLHAPATLLAVTGRTNADRTPAPGHVLRLLCGDCADRTREIMKGGARAVTFLTVGPGLSESQLFQVGEARDILGTWDLADPGGISRETVLADQVRNLLAIIGQTFPAGAEEPA